MDCFTRWRGFAMTLCSSIPAGEQSKTMNRKDAKTPSDFLKHGDLSEHDAIREFSHPEAKLKDLSPVLCLRSFAALRMTKAI